MSFYWVPRHFKTFHGSLKFKCNVFINSFKLGILLFLYCIRRSEKLLVFLKDIQKIVFYAYSLLLLCVCDHMQVGAHVCRCVRTYAYGGQRSTVSVIPPQSSTLFFCPLTSKHTLWHVHTPIKHMLIYYYQIKK